MRFPYVKRWNDKVDWPSTLAVYFLFVVFIPGFFFLIIKSVQVGNERAAKQQSFREKCIEAGGYPASPYDYVRGHGNGNICIKPDGWIELKEENK